MTKHRDDRDVRDQAGVGPDARQVRHLRPLSEMKHIRIAKGEPDVRGWTVYTSTGREIGEVQDLLVDPTIGHVVMLDLDLPGTDRRSLAPIRAAWIDREAKRVVLDAAQIRDDELIPSLARGDATDEEWVRFEDGYRRAYGTRGFDDTADWHLRHADDELRFGRRRGDRAAADTADDYRIERRRLEAAEREREVRDRLERERTEREEAAEAEVHYDEHALRAERPVVVEEHVVRRRVVPPEELDNPR